MKQMRWGSCFDLMNQLGERVAHVGDVIIKVGLWLLAGLAIAIVAWRSFFCFGGTGRGQTAYSSVIVLVPYS